MAKKSKQPTTPEDVLRDLYNAAFDQERALAYGWMLAENGDETLAIQRDDDRAVFADDDEARAFALKRAFGGDANAALAAALVALDQALEAGEDR